MLSKQFGETWKAFGFFWNSNAKCPPDLPSAGYPLCLPWVSTPYVYSGCLRGVSMLCVYLQSLTNLVHIVDLVNVSAFGFCSLTACKPPEAAHDWDVFTGQLIFIIRLICCWVVVNFALDSRGGPLCSNREREKANYFSPVNLSIFNVVWTVWTKELS